MPEPSNRSVSRDSRKEPLPEESGPGFERFDSFGKPVSLTFRGESSYKSVCGACMTLIVYALSLTVAILLILDLSQESD